MAPMMNDVTSHEFKKRDRINLRLSQDILALIDDARSHRPGKVSRNTWIMEAISEKLGRKEYVDETQFL